MRCPSCHKAELSAAQLEEDLSTQDCPECGGHWLDLSDYLTWRQRSLNDNEANQVSDNQDNGPTIIDTKALLICPKTGHLMSKYRISVDHNYKLDYSKDANAIWIDRGEWALLKEANLISQLSKILSPEWQKQIQEDYSEQLLEERYQEILGDDYVKANELYQWLKGHPKKDFILNYIKIRFTRP